MLFVLYSYRTIVWSVLEELGPGWNSIRRRAGANSLLIYLGSYCILKCLTDKWLGLVNELDVRARHGL